MASDTKQLSRRPDAIEVQATSNDIADAVNAGVDACDELDILIEVADKAIKVSDAYRGKRNLAKKKLTELAMRL